MDVKQHAWATEALVASAKESADELEKELRWHELLILCFVPLVACDPSGAYRVGSSMPLLVCYSDGSIEWCNLAGLVTRPHEPAFASFEEECNNASNTLYEYLTRLLTYALAHGMDVAKVNGEGFGRSILQPLPHSELHTDVPEYDT